MTLVLGQPGSGKSSLLKILSGRFPLTKTIQLDGEVSYNGHDRLELTKQLPQLVAYVTQRDNHFSTLSVQETLKFAYDCCGGEMYDDKHFTKGSLEEIDAALESLRALKEHHVDLMVQQLGLEHCQGTLVGDTMTRGVSGGERKRVTMGEMGFGNHVVNLMDEVSTGLDSAATFDIIKTQRSAARNLRMTIVIALLQPSPEVFALFDNVLLLNKGQVMYHGPCNQVVAYFQSIGLKCPQGRDVADFLLDLVTDKQKTCEATGLQHHPRSASEFAECFELSSQYHAIMEALDAHQAQQLEQDMTEHFLYVPEFKQSFFESTWTLLQREFKVTWRNGALIKGRIFPILILALIHSTLNYQFDTKDPLVLGTIFPAVLVHGLTQTTRAPLYLETREIIYKQRAANFYRTSSYVLATSISQVALSFIETWAYDAIVYWICGFVADVGAFLVFEHMLFVTSLAFGAWFFFTAALSRNLLVAEPISMLSMLLYILFAGFTITKDAIPDYFIWAYWANPVAWGFRALAVNQYRHPDFDVYLYDGVDFCGRYGKTLGRYALDAYSIPSGEYWVSYGVLFMLGSYVLFLFLAAIVLENVRYESPENVSLDNPDDYDSSCDSQRTPVLPSKSSNGMEFELYSSPRSSQVVLEMRHSPRATLFEPVILAFEDLWYSVPDPNDSQQTIDLLKGVSGFALPGTITALMGSSGAGTLMDVIAGRKTGGSIRGRILLNGHEATDIAIRRVTGYCEQADIHSEASTIREALVFSAFLRQSSDVPNSQKYDSLEECLDLLGLRPIADKIIRGSSVEQLKRISIGVELVAQPSVLFLDEPTSGLDARSAKLIMDGVRKVAYTGRTVVCTIHQPSSEVFQFFDSLLLLKRGGETVFFGELGPQAHELIKYFEAIPGILPLEPEYNPASWMLDVIGAGVSNGKDTAALDEEDETDFAGFWRISEKKARLDVNLRRPGLCSPVTGSAALRFKAKRAASEWTQASFLLDTSATCIGARQTTP